MRPGILDFLFWTAMGGGIGAAGAYGFYQTKHFKRQLNAGVSLQSGYEMLYEVVRRLMRLFCHSTIFPARSSSTDRLGMVLLFCSYRQHDHSKEQRAIAWFMGYGPELHILLRTFHLYSDSPGDGRAHH